MVQAIQSLEMRIQAVEEKQGVQDREHTNTRKGSQEEEKLCTNSPEKSHGSVEIQGSDVHAVIGKLLQAIQALELRIQVVEEQPHAESPEATSSSKGPQTQVPIGTMSP